MHRWLVLTAVAAGCRGSSASGGSAAAAPVPADAAPAATPCPEPPPPAPLACDPPAPAEATSTTGADTLRLRPARFADLPGWEADRLSEALPAFRASCAQLATLADDAPIGAGPFAGRARDWRAACAVAAAVPDGDDAAARAFFEREFHAYAASGRDGADGRYTGYYVHPLRGSRARGGRYQFPLYRRPADLVSVQLGDFIDDARGRRIWGRYDASRGVVLPYATRAEVHRRDPGFAEVLLWADDPADVIAAEIEGSARATLPDGSEVWLGFDGKNGLDAHRTGATLRAARALAASFSDDERDPAALDRRLARYFEVSDPKESIVFFQVQGGAGAIGTQEVALTPRRSLAVDRAVIALSTPVWVSTRAPDAPGAPAGPWRHLLIAQDTGGHILGTVRGDIYFGDDAAAVAVGNRVNTAGRMWLLLPRALTVPTR